ncbi:tigger transposable element-derived protein 1-like protein, partial [Leptotrombidium deliense]
MDAILMYASSSDEDNDSLYEPSSILRRHEYDTIEEENDENENIMNIPTAEVVSLNEIDDEDVQIILPDLMDTQRTVYSQRIESSQSSAENSVESSGSSNVELGQSSQENCNEEIGSIRGKTRRSYTINDKLQALKTLLDNENNVKKTAKQLQVDATMLRRWRKSRNKFELMKKDNEVAIRRRRLVRSDKNKFKPELPETENLLINWFNERRNKGLAINQRELKFQAIKINNELQERSAFSASNGWIDRFINRHGLSMRTATSVGQKVPMNAKELANNFLQYIKDYNEKHANCDIIYANMDEVPVWFDMPGNKTYNKKGARIVPLKTT